MQQAFNTLLLLAITIILSSQLLRHDNEIQQLRGELRTIGNGHNEITAEQLRFNANTITTLKEVQKCIKDLTVAGENHTKSINALLKLYAMRK